jgi:hypothetical protein
MEPSMTQPETKFFLLVAKFQNKFGRVRDDDNNEAVTYE